MAPSTIPQRQFLYRATSPLVPWPSPSGCHIAVSSFVMRISLTGDFTCSRRLEKPHKIGTGKLDRFLLWVGISL
jgi:hypothetical protein